MIDILGSYRETKRQSVKRKSGLENKRGELELDRDLKAKELKRLKLKDGIEGAQEIERVEQAIYAIGQAIHKINHDIGIMNAAISDTSYVIKWITTGRMPGTTRGMERQSVYKREIAFDDKWIDLLADKGVELHELPEPDREEQEMKVDLVADLNGYLTPKQQEVFVMLAEGAEQTEIAEALGISKQAVSGMVKRGRRTIKDAGWILV